MEGSLDCKILLEVPESTKGTLMPIYSLSACCGFVKRRFETTPVIALETDGNSDEALPAGVRDAVDYTIPASLNGLRSLETPHGSDGVLTWLSGDSVLSGSPALVRHDLRFLGRCTFVPVHVPCLDEIPFVTIQPRWFRAGRRRAYWNFDFRIQSEGASSHVLQVLEQNGQPWAQLARAVLQEKARAGAGVEFLVRLWERAERLPTFVAALVLRNLVVVTLLHNGSAQAKQFLDAGIKRYPGYAELYYLGALLAVREQRFGQVLPFLEKARTNDGGLLGSGGEGSYRIDWLMGILAAHVGNERAAFGYLLEGMKSETVFIPAVEELLKLRVSRRLVEAHRWEFSSVARHAPRLLQKIVEYLLLHRAFAVAKHIVSTAAPDQAIRAELEQRLSSAQAPFRNGSTPRSAKPGILLTGGFFEYTSLARINRELAKGLFACQRLDVCLEPSSPPSLPTHMVPEGELLKAALLRHPGQLELTVRHQWPPDFRRTSRGKLAVITPWEYGAVPRIWVEHIERHVDELWVPSQFVRTVFQRSGVEAERMRVIPNGVDVNLFAPAGPAFRPPGSRNFVFLFIGGAIRRKGVDLLLAAYRTAFDPGEDVTLLLAISGATGMYRHNSLIPMIQHAANDRRGAHVQLLLDPVNDATLASLYRGCDAFVLPYRGEGFGMPLLEAMACGKPVITTAAGPSRDFCLTQTSYLVPAREEEVPDEPPPLGELIGVFTWFEPDFAELQQSMRDVYEHREEAAQRGRAAAKRVRDTFAWSRITQVYAGRVSDLVGANTSAKSS